MADLKLEYCTRCIKRCGIVAIRSKQWWVLLCHIGRQSAPWYFCFPMMGKRLGMNHSFYCVKCRSKRTVEVISSSLVGVRPSYSSALSPFTVFGFVPKGLEDQKKRPIRVRLHKLWYVFIYGMECCQEVSREVGTWRPLPAHQIQWVDLTKLKRFKFAEHHLGRKSPKSHVVYSHLHPLHSV